MAAPVVHLGALPLTDPIEIPWDSQDLTGAPVTASGFVASDIVIYKNGSLTQRSSSSGITVSTDFDGTTGLHLIVIDPTDNADAGFYAAGGRYLVAVNAVTVNGISTRFWLASFRLGTELTTILADSVPADGTRPTPSQALYAIYQFLTEREISGTDLIVKKPDGTTALMHFTLDDATNPTSITRTS